MHVCKVAKLDHRVPGGKVSAASNFSHLQAYLANWNVNATCCCFPLALPWQVYGQLRRLKLSANWVLMVAFARPLPLPQPFEGAFVKDSAVLSWAANNTAKLGLGLGLAGKAAPGGVECWTLISTQEYGWQNKVPQVHPLGVKCAVRGQILPPPCRLPSIALPAACGFRL